MSYKPPPTFDPETGDPLWAEVPDWLSVSPRPTPEQVREITGVQDPKRLRAAAEAALDSEMAKLRAHGAEPGTGRHTALYAASCALGRHVAAGGLSMAEARAGLQQASQALGLPTNAEAAHQVEKGLGDGLGEPYVLTDRPSVTEPATLQANGQPAPKTGRVLRVRAFTELELRYVEWGWEQRVPLGKLTILGGLAGQGKSQLTTWVTARLSRGELPGALRGEPVSVVMVSAEDDPEDTIYPRLLLAGADVSMVHVVDVRRYEDDGTVTPGGVELPGDSHAILEALRATGARLIVLDPISGLLDGDHSAYNSQQVRHALGPLKGAVEELHAAAILVTHVLPKASGTDALARLADSHAFTGLPRSVLILGPDPADEEGDRGPCKVLTVAKSNLADRGEHGLAFRLTGRVMVGDGRGGIAMAARMDLIGPTSATTADTLGGGGEQSALRDAEEWLVEQLEAGPKQAGTLQTGAQGSGIAAKTLRRARERICKRPYKRGVGPWWWELRPVDDLPPYLHGHLGHVGHLPDASRDAEGAQGAQGAHGGLVVPLFGDDDGLSDDAKPPEETT